jgi:hypothetical protein
VASPLAPLKVVRCSPSCPDPALDTSVDEETGRPRSDLRAYIQTRDASVLAFKADVAPTWFHVKRLPEAWLAEVLDTVHPLAAQRRAAFRAAVHLIETSEGPLKVTPQKQGDKTSQYVAHRADHGVEMAPSDFVQEVADRFGAEVIQEMGAVALDFARLPRSARGPFSLWDGTVVTA